MALNWNKNNLKNKSEIKIYNLKLITKKDKK